MKILTSVTLDTSRKLGLLRSLDANGRTQEAACGITMAGKIGC